MQQLSMFYLLKLAAKFEEDALILQQASNGTWREKVDVLRFAAESIHKLESASVSTHQPKHDGQIGQFQGVTRWLSNFEKCTVRWDGYAYPTTEHAYQAAKKPLLRDAIRANGSPREAKRLGSTPPLPTGWEQWKLLVMYSLLRQKYAQEPWREYLLNTKTAYLEEGNSWGDRFWGVSPAYTTGTGFNWLGIATMAVRERLLL
jgi:ribA/ribD-fused uncharacterized protein